MSDPAKEETTSLSALIAQVEAQEEPSTRARMLGGDRATVPLHEAQVLAAALKDALELLHENELWMAACEGDPEPVGKWPDFPLKSVRSFLDRHKEETR